MAGTEERPDRGAGELTAGELAEEFLEHHRRGERPEISEYVERYPELADEIRELFPAMLLMEQIKPGSGTERDRSQTPKQLGEYRILREVGRGGMGVVYEAEQLSLGRRVALKVLPSHALLRESQRERFRREAQAAAGLHHTNIVPVYGVGEEEGVHFYAMQFIHGESLEKVIEELRVLRSESSSDARNTESTAGKLLSGELERHFSGESPAVEEASAIDTRDEESDDSRAGEKPAWESSSATLLDVDSAESHTRSSRERYFRTVARLGRQAAEALAHAHSEGILHRDVKPSNLLLDTRGTLWVTDFGLAKAEGTGTLTHTGDVVGTLGYMAPERLEGWSDPRSDVYGLGLTLYELLTLRRAFDEPDRRRLMKKVAEEEPPRPCRLEPHIPRDLETIVLKAIEKEPERRYRSMEDLGGDLTHYLRNEPLRARRPSALDRLTKWSRRNRAAAAAAVVVLLTVAVASTLSTALIWKENQETRAALLDAELRGYVANVNAALLNLEKGNSLQARRQLEACPEDLREWEWRHAWLGVDQSLLTLTHGGDVMAVAFSPDGKRIASGGRGIHLWEVSTGRLVRTLVRAGQDFFPLDYSPDGTRIVAGGNDKVFLWDAESWELLRTLEGGRPAAFGPDGAHLAVLSPREARLRVVDASTYEVVATLEVHPEGYGQLAWSPDSERLAVPDRHTVVVWELSSRNTVFVLKAPGAIMSAAFSPDGRLIAAGLKQRGLIPIWDATSGELLRTLHGHEIGPLALSFAPDGTRLVTASEDGSLRLWETETGKLLGFLPGHEDRVRCTVFSRDGRRIVSSSLDGTVRVWDAEATGNAVSVLRHGERIISATFSPDGKRIASGTESGVVRLRDAGSGDLIATLRGHKAGASAAFSPDSMRLVSVAVGESTLRVWDVESGRHLRDFGKHAGGLSSMAFHPRREQVASGEKNGAIRLWDVSSGQAMATLRGHEGEVLDLAFGPDGDLLVSGSLDGTVCLWDVDAHRRVRTLRGHSDWVYGVAFSPDGRRIVSCSRDRTARIWDVRTGNALATLPEFERGATCAAFSPDGRRLAIASAVRNLRLFDAESLALLATVSAHEGWINTIAFSPSGDRLLSVAEDNTLRIWETRQSSLRQMWRGASTRARLEPLLDRLFRQHLLVDPVVQTLRADGSLPAADRERAIRLARGRGDPSPDELEAADWEAVRTHLDEAISRAEQQWTLYAERARADVALEDWKSAAADHAKMLDLAPEADQIEPFRFLAEDEALARAILAEIQFHSGRTSEAVHTLEEAARLAGENSALEERLEEYRRAALPDLPSYGAVDAALQDLGGDWPGLARALRALEIGGGAVTRAVLEKCAGSGLERLASFAKAALGRLEASGREGPSRETTGEAPEGRAKALPRQVFHDSFEEGAAPVWSPRSRTETTPSDGRAFLGPFGNRKVSLRLEDLPPHRYVRVSFDLLVIRSWDGNSGRLRGPDIWELRVDGGPLLFRTTFAAAGPRQSYPDFRGVAEHASQTGANEINELGYTFLGEPRDSVYRMAATFPHRAAALTLRFSASGLWGGLLDESWGLDEVTVETVDTETRRGPEELQRLWKVLCGREPILAERAFWDFVASGTEGATFLQACVETFLAERRWGENLLEDFRGVASGDDAEARILYLEGRILERRGRHREAVARYRRVLLLDSTRPEPCLRLSESLRALGETDEAESYLEEALARDPRRLVEALFDEQLLLQKVLEAIRENNRLDPENRAEATRLAQERGDPTAGARMLELELEPTADELEPFRPLAKGEAEALALLAQMHFNSGRRREAVRKLEEATRRFLGSPYLKNLLHEYRTAILPDLASYASIDAVLETGTQWLGPARAVRALQISGGDASTGVLRKCVEAGPDRLAALAAEALGDLDRRAGARVLDAEAGEEEAGERDAGEPEQPLRVFHDDFEDGAAPQWSPARIDSTPVGSRKFLGQFGKEEVLLCLEQLPPHRYLRVSFDLFIIRSWDGNGIGDPRGPDLWKLRVDGGPSLFRTTFVHLGGGEQSYPDAHGVASHRLDKGVIETATLGYTFKKHLKDRVYRLSATFPHRSPSLTLRFSASGIDDLPDESWGLDEVSVEILPVAPRKKPEELRGLWDALGGADPIRAERALWELVATGSQGVEYVVSQIEGHLANWCEKLLEDFRQVSTGDDARSRVLYLEGRLLARSGRHDEAVARFREVLDSDASRPEPCLQLSRSLRAVGKADEADFWYQEALARDLPRLVRELFEEHLLLEWVVDEIESSDHLDAKARREAIRLACERGNPTASELNKRSWAVARRPDASPREYSQALHRAEAACEMAPDSPRYLNTLGVAQYRAARLEEALRTLERTDRLNRASEEPHNRALDLLFIAMSHERLGKAKEARRVLAEARTFMRADSNAQLKGFLREAEELIGR